MSYFYLKHKVLYLGIVQISSHHSSQQAHIPCNLWCDSWIPCGGYQIRIVLQSILQTFICMIQHIIKKYPIDQREREREREGGGEREHAIDVMYHHDHPPSKKKTE